jgi:hypothetical protein
LQAFDWDKFYDLVVKWIAMSNQPFTEIENPEFRALITFLKPFVGKKMCKADQLRSLVMEQSEKAQNRMKKILEVSDSSMCAEMSNDKELTYHIGFKSVPGEIALATDAWTSSNRKSFMSLCLSYIDANWELRDAVVGFTELQGSHSGKNLAEAMYKVISDLGIVKKVRQNVHIQHLPLTVKIDHQYHGRQCQQQRNHDGAP